MYTYRRLSPFVGVFLGLLTFLGVGFVHLQQLTRGEYSNTSICVNLVVLLNIVSIGCDVYPCIFIINLG